MERDGLTGLLLRGQYEEDLKKFPQNDLCVVYFDVNNLKHTNDNLGHRFGDKLLLAAVSCMKNNFRNENIYRTGGDEFIILANGIGPNVVEKRLQNISDEMDRYTKEDTDGVIYQVASGYCIGDGIMSKQEIEEKAESRMYQNKKDLKAKANHVKTEKKVISNEAYADALKELGIKKETPKKEVSVQKEPEPVRPIPLVDRFIKKAPVEPLIISGTIILTFIVLIVFLRLA